MKLIFRYLEIIIVLTFFTSCASIVSRSKWPLTVETNPKGAKIEIFDRYGISVYTGNTPASLYLNSGAGYFKKQIYKITINIEGYNERIIQVESHLNGWWYIGGNFLIGGLIGYLVVDPLTGAMYKLDTKYINETLTKNSLSNFNTELKILNMRELSTEMKSHLVALK